MDWFVLAFLSAGLLAGFTLAQRKFSTGAHDVDDINSSQAFQLACGLVFVVVALLAGKPVFAQMPLVNALILTFGYGLGSLCMFAALKRVSASNFTVLFTTRIVWTAVLSWLILHDGFTAAKIVAIACIVAAVGLVSYDKKSGQLLKLDKGVLYALGAGLFFGIATVNDAYILQGDVDVLSYLGPAFLLPGILLLVVGGKKTLRLAGLIKRRDFQKNLLLTTAFYAASSLCFYFAIKQGDITPVSVVNQSQVILIAVGGILLLRERQHLPLKIAGVLLATVGLVLVAIG